MKNHRIPGLLAQWLRRALFSTVLALAACGGGGGGGGSSNNNAPVQPAPKPSAVQNAVTVSVAQGVQGTPNIPVVSVTVCAPGGTNCQMIDNVQVDTESFGLRLMSTVLSPTLAGALPTLAASSGGTLAECENFADGYTWGTVRTADVTIGGETASAIPIQVVGDLASSSVPPACQGVGPGKFVPGDIGANGILGIGVAPTDCGAACAASPPTATQLNNGYYGCPGGTGCTGTVVTVAQTVANPVPHFPLDNNGVSLQLPAVPDTGAPSASGTLFFGIGTQSNNALTATQRLLTDQYGHVTATFNGASVYAFLDSGSNGLYFTDSAIPACTGSGDWPYFYCPPQTVALNATLTGFGQTTSASVNFNVANAQMLYNTGNLAFNDIGGSLGTSLDLGLPFFYGKTVYYGYGAAPFVAF